MEKHKNYAVYVPQFVFTKHAKVGTTFAHLLSGLVKLEIRFYQLLVQGKI